MASVAILLRCHKRTEVFRAVLDQCLYRMPLAGVHTEIVLMPDKPTPEVVDIVNEYKGHSSVHVVNPKPCKGHRWGKTGMMGFNDGMRYIDECLSFVDWIHYRDDDWILGLKWKNTLKQCLSDKNALAWAATFLCIWEDEENYEPLVNLNNYHVLAPVFFRYVKGDRFPEDGRSITVADGIQTRILRNPDRCKQLPFYIYDYGVTNLTIEEKQKMVNAMNSAGKDDLYTQALVGVPQLVELSKIIREDIPPEVMAGIQFKESMKK